MLYDYTYGTTNPIDTDADLQKIKDRSECDP